MMTVEVFPAAEPATTSSSAEPRRRNVVRMAGASCVDRWFVSRSTPFGSCGFERRKHFVIRPRGGEPWQSVRGPRASDRKSTRLNSSHSQISYAVFCLKKKKIRIQATQTPEPDTNASYWIMLAKRDEVASAGATGPLDGPTPPGVACFHPQHASVAAAD